MTFRTSSRRGLSGHPDIPPLGGVRNVRSPDCPNVRKMSGFLSGKCPEPKTPVSVAFGDFRGFFLSVKNRLSQSFTDEGKRRFFFWSILSKITDRGLL